MFDLSKSELQEIDTNLDGTLALARQRSPEAAQLALDASRLLACTSDRLDLYKDQGFFKRCWYTLSGKTGSLQRANQADLIKMQKHAWQYINLLQDQNLMTVDAIISVKNNLMTLALDQDDIKKEITRLADKVYDRFVALETRVEHLETSNRIHHWLGTLQAREYDVKYPESIRLLRIVGDFYNLKSAEWDIDDLISVRQALLNVGIDVQKTISVSEYITGVIDDVTTLGYDQFSSIVPPYEDQTLNNLSVINDISSPSFGALYQIKDNYTSSARIIRSLQKRLDVSYGDAIKIVLMDFVDEMGIDTRVEVPLGDLAIEMLSCYGLTQQLATHKEILSVTDTNSNNNTKEITAECTEEDNNNDKNIEKITKRLNSLAKTNSGLFVTPNIPEKKFENFASKISDIIVDEDEILAYIDTTFWGSGTEGIGICKNGIYLNGTGNKPAYITWIDIQKVKNKDIYAKGYDIFIGDHSINVATGKVTPDDIVKAINYIKKLR